MTISTRIRRLADTLNIAEAHDNIFCSVGTHPHDAHEELDIPADEIVRLAAHPKVVAIGEAGLDYFYDNSPPEAQAQGLRTHIAAAQETGLPLVIHARDADDDIAAILEQEMAQEGASRPSCTASRAAPSSPARALELGLYVSFSGIITFKKSETLRDIAADVPLDRLLVETDAPFLAPGKYRGKPNEPAFVVHTAAELAQGEGRHAGGDGAGDDRQLLPPLRQDAAERRCRGMSIALHDPGLRLLRRRAAHRQHLGRLRSGQPEESPPALLAAGGAHSASGGARRCWSTRRPICASSC